LAASRQEGVIGRFSLDFVVVRSMEMSHTPSDQFEKRAEPPIPFFALQFLTDGTYDPQSAIFNCSERAAKNFSSASDHVESPLYGTLLRTDLFDIDRAAQSALQSTRQTGRRLSYDEGSGRTGRTGLTGSGATSHEEARDLYARAVAVLNEEAQAG